jgi:protease-4
MKINKLASAISRGKWLIEPRTEMAERRRAISFLKGDFDNIEAVEPELDKPYAIKAGNYFDITDDDSDIFGIAEAGSVAIIPVCGTIMKYDYCGSPGTDTLSMWLKAAINSPQIDAIVLLVNSGGGSVEGTGEFADLIKEAEKTILAFCDGLMASAAYWIGCSAKEIWASHATTEFGSIGTAVCFMDDTEAMEKYGFKKVYINADSSPDKNQDVIKAIEGDDADLKENIINPTNEIFTSTVKANREGKLKLFGDGDYKEPLTGKVYLAERSIEIGLIDGICTMEKCVERALQLSQKENKETTKISNQTRKYLKYQYNGN